jgi:hypothetical protein
MRGMEGLVCVQISYKCVKGLEMHDCAAAASAEVIRLSPSCSTLCLTRPPSSPFTEPPAALLLPVAEPPLWQAMAAATPDQSPNHQLVVYLVTNKFNYITLAA